ncbi:hypothetical protein C8J56DRAFT_792317 [Mycena floridula]|nr:hypothetical protein C8J56DRAFT_792317 [Mycena floridula]
MNISNDSLLVERGEIPGRLALWFTRNSDSYFTGLGHGLFSRQSITASFRLFTIPASAMMNIRTLSPHYPNAKLSAIQLISLHLALHRHNSDPLFGPYISILPTDFAFHPLTWLVNHQEHCSSHPEEELLQQIPLGTRDALDHLVSRFLTDYNTVASGKYAKSLKKSDFLWGWLNVNTRCIYHRMKSSRSDPDNLTLCPILDFANHTSTLAVMVPEPSHAEIWNIAPRSQFGDDFTLLSPPNVAVPKDSEMYLTYGAHSNRTLFVEYGFVEDIFRNGSLHGEVDMQRLVEPLFDEKPELKEILVAAGYWGDWTLHSWNESSYPSFRLITALRLYCGQDSDETIRRWYDTVMGRVDHISETNERAWRDLLAGLCQHVFAGDEKQMSDPRLVALWQEQILVAKSVHACIIEGKQF